MGVGVYTTDSEVLIVVLTPMHAGFWAKSGGWAFTRSWADTKYFTVVVSGSCKLLVSVYEPAEGGEAPWKIDSVFAFFSFPENDRLHGALTTKGCVH